MTDEKLPTCCFTVKCPICEGFLEQSGYNILMCPVCGAMFQVKIMLKEIGDTVH